MHEYRPPHWLSGRESRVFIGPHPSQSLAATTSSINSWRGPLRSYALTLTLIFCSKRHKRLTPVARILLSIALPAETKLINYLHCASVWNDRKQRRGGSIQSNRSASPQQHPSRSISPLFKILFLALVLSLLSWWVNKTDLTYIHIHKHTHTHTITVNMELYLCLQSVPDRMSCPPWPKGKKLVHLDLKGAPPRVEYLHKVRAFSVIGCNTPLAPFRYSFFLFVCFCAVHWCVFPSPSPAHRSVL